jgi:hypothetical protein
MDSESKFHDSWKMQFSFRIVAVGEQQFGNELQDLTEGEALNGIVLAGASGCGEGEYPRQESNL